jgi:predicted phosphodiesterase
MTRLALKVSSSPRRDKVFSSLTDLLQAIRDGKTERGLSLQADINEARYIIFSDQHKGAGDLADDFHPAEKNYLAALQYYHEKNFNYINLGDCEELWECKPQVTIDQNKVSLLAEKKFLQDSRYYRIFGNHDLEWSYAIQQNLYLKPIFGETLKIYEGILLNFQHNDSTYTLFLTHGHQGDIKSDGNAVSKWVVAAIWTPIQRFLEINLNSLSDSFGLVDRHNGIMSDWSATQKNLVFISGHTHKPVFASLDHIDRLKKQQGRAAEAGNQAEVNSIQHEIDKRMVEYSGKYTTKVYPHPSYFNTGCCCFEDGDISGIEIENGFLRLVKWQGKGRAIKRVVLEESPLSYLFDKL